LLRAADVHFAYRRDTPILNGVSVEVRPGEITGILGPNGSGKTTLLRILSGTLEPARGRVMLDGVSLNRLPRTELARRMAIVPQETQLAFDYSVLEVVLMGRYPHLRTFEIEGPEDFQIARDVLRATGTLALENRLFATLSGGEKQRVIIAGALAQIRTPPGATAQPLLLLDEPTTALDLGYLLDTAELLRELQRRLALAIVISTHDLNFAAALCRSLVLIKAGRIRASGPTNDVLNAANIRELYGVDADVHHHAAAGHLVVVPVSRGARGLTQ
jgi:ABC-type cobalamin/Fe3+-siderophores transport system ATPase subunit